MSLDPATTAIVLIEYQNEFTSDGGALHGAVAEHGNAIAYDYPCSPGP